jgi:hypothetical protein
MYRLSEQQSSRESGVRTLLSTSFDVFRGSEFGVVIFFKWEVRAQKI